MQNQKGILKLIMLILSCCLVFTPSLQVLANENELIYEEIMPRYVNILKATATLAFSESEAMCTTNLTAKSTTSLSITMTLKKLSDGSWIPIKTWEKSKSSALSCNMEKRIEVPNGTYRLNAVFICGGEKCTVSSGIKIK